MPDDMDGRFLDDETLARRAGRGETAAFAELVTRWWVPISHLAWSVLGNVPEAVAVAEETFLASVPRAGPSRVPIRISLYRLALRLSLARRRSPSRAGGRKARMDEALGQLEDLDLAALVLRDVQLFSLHEAAAILETPADEVRARVHRAWLFLARLLEARKGHPGLPSA
ncbi:MAG TPA: hypothetical protein VE964_14390 [Myxococcales bacterium]|nr:hypothetical protein [Myxococcales bacterium]